MTERDPAATAEPPKGGVTPRPGTGTRDAQPISTRDRILDTALQLFTELGFDATTLQEIADRLGFTKAAIYYHYRSKEDILMALHMRMHQIGRDALAELTEGPVTLDVWESLLDTLLDEMLVQRPLFLMHERNQAVLERLHRNADHDAQHEDFLARLRQILSDPAVPLRDRVRMSCSLGAIFSVLFVGGASFDAGSDEVGALLRDALHDLLNP
jgi:AcrR family transcriptional regulator